MAETYPAYEQRPRRRWGRRLFVTLVVLLLVLGGVFVAADRAAASFAERKIAAQVRQEAADKNVQSSQPEVSVRGFPFLTQVVAGRYESISILMRDVRGAVEGNTVNLPELDIDARDVTASIDTLRTGRGEVKAKTVEGTGTITYDSVAKLIDRPGIKLSEKNGKLAVTAPLEFLGREFTVQGTANLAIKEGQVQIRFEDLTAAELPQIPAAQALVNGFAKQISINFKLPALPFQMVVQEARPLPEGLAVTATAKDVPLNAVT